MLKTWRLAPGYPNIFVLNQNKPPCLVIKKEINNT